ncbi:MAG: 50S ribosomal protein L25/general stress protein Ctc [Gammaproteobacteria bacterium]
MSHGKFELSATVRNDMGKGASRRLRRLENCVPGIVYGAEKAAQPISLIEKDVKKALENEAFYSHILKLTIDGKTEQVVLKDLQRHPYKARLLHLDFLRVSATQKLHMHIPLHFINQETAPGVKEGGLVSHHVVELEVKCLPADLPEYIEIDMGQLGMDGVIHLSDVKLPKGVELIAHVDEEHDTPVASIHRLRAAVEEETTAEAEAAPGPEATDANSPASEEKKQK